MATSGATASASTSWIERHFQLAARHTTIGRELQAGLITFLVSSYIIFVNPSILASGDLEGRGPGFIATLTATCLIAGLMTIMMGWFTNYPFMIAPGMGLNAVVAYQLILGEGLPWQAAMGVIFMEGLVLTVLVLLGFREALMDAVPLVLRRAIAIGIGLFLMIIGAVNGGLIVAGGGTPLALGNLASVPVLLTIFALIFTYALMVRRTASAFLVGILTTAVVGIALHTFWGIDVSNVPGVQGALPPAFLGPDFSSIGQGFNFGAFTILGLLGTLLAVFTLGMSDLMDTVGTGQALGEQAGLMDESNRLPQSRRFLLTDSLGAVVGGLFGGSSGTTYIESASGISAGGRTGLTTIATGVLFLLCLGLAPLAGIVTAESTAAALMLVGFLMFRGVRQIDFTDVEEGWPALLVIVGMLLTYSITDGIGFGVIFYVLAKLFAGKTKEVSPLMWVLWVLFIAYFFAQYLG